MNESDHENIKQRLDKTEKNNKIQFALLVVILAFIIILALKNFNTNVTSPPCKQNLCRQCPTLSLTTEDNLAIQNTLHTYPHAFNSGDAEAVLSLFTDDAVMIMNIPGQPPVKLEGKQAISNLFNDRVKQFAEMKIQRRHMMTNLLFLDTSEQQAHVKAYFLLGSTKDNQLSFVTTGVYEGILVKQQGKWLIKHWIDNLDKGVDVPVKSN